MVKVYKYYDCKKKGIARTIVLVFLVDVVITVISNTFVLPYVKKWQMRNKQQDVVN